VTPPSLDFPPRNTFSNIEMPPTMIVYATTPLIENSWLEALGSNSLLLGLDLLGIVLKTIPHQIYSATYP